MPLVCPGVVCPGVVGIHASLFWSVPEWSEVALVCPRVFWSPTSLSCGCPGDPLVCLGVVGSPTNLTWSGVVRSSTSLSWSGLESVPEWSVLEWSGVPLVCPGVVCSPTSLSWSGLQSH